MTNEQSKDRGASCGPRGEGLGNDGEIRPADAGRLEACPTNSKRADARGGCRRHRVLAKVLRRIDRLKQTRVGLRMQLHAVERKLADSEALVNEMTGRRSPG